MAGTVINTFSTTDINILNMMEVLDELRKGRCHIMLTNLDNTSAPVVKTGSIVEVAGATYEFDTDTAISGTATDGVVFIKMVPYLDGTTWKLRPEWTNTEPVVSAAKRGLYGVDANENHRYVYMMLKSGSSYSAKMPYYDYNSSRVEQTKFIAGSGTTNVVNFDFPVDAITALRVFDTSAPTDGRQPFELLTDITVQGNSVVINGPLHSYDKIICTAISKGYGLEPKNFSSIFFRQPKEPIEQYYSKTFSFPFIIKNYSIAMSNVVGNCHCLCGVSVSGYDITIVTYGFSSGNYTHIPMLLMANG